MCPAEINPSGKSDRFAGWLLAFPLVLLILYMQVRPGLAWPRHGILQACILTAVLALSVYFAGFSRKVRLPTLALAAGTALTAFAAWVWVRTTLSAMHGEEAAFMSGSLVLAAGAFWVGLLSGGWGGRRAIRGAVLFIIAIAVLHALYAVYQYHLLFPIEYAQRRTMTHSSDLRALGILHQLAIRRVGSSFGNPNVFAGFLAMFLPCFAAGGWFLKSRKDMEWPVVLLMAATALGLVLYALHRTDSTGGQMVAAVGMAATALACFSAAYYSHHRIRRLALGIGFLFVLAIASLALPLGPVSLQEKSATSQAVTPRSQKTLLQRVYYLESAWAMFRERPLLGHGADAFAELYPQYRVKGAGEARYAHNFVAQTAVESGIVGLALLGLFALFCLWSIVFGFRRDGLDAGRLALTGVIGLFVADSLGEYTFYVREVLIVVSLIAGIVVGAIPPPDSKRKNFSAVISLMVLIFVGAALWPTSLRPLRVREALRSGRDYLVEVAYGDSLTVREQRAILGEALRQAEIAAHLNPRNAEAWSLRAAVDETMGRPDAAIESMRQAVSRAPRSAALRAQMARLFWPLGRKGQALDAARMATQLHPLDARHRLQYAHYLATLGRRAEAMDEVERALEEAILPEDIAAAENMQNALKGGE